MQLELKQRILSGIVLGLAVLVLTYFGGLPFRLFAALLAILIYVEWTAIIRARAVSMPAYIVGWAIVVFVALLTVLGAGREAVVAIILGCGLVAMVSWLTGSAAWFVLGIVYAGFSGLALAEIRGETAIGLVAMAFVFAVVWATDIMAYFCGRALGGPKLAPKISPGKTWSGAIFGTLAGMAAGTAVALVSIDRGGLWVPLLSAVLAVTSQIGDLFESWLKRRYAVKDSGRLIPGHGGVMDRVDGLVFAAFAAFLIGLAIAGGLPGSATAPPIAASLFAL